MLKRGLTHTKYISLQMIVFLVCKQLTPVTMFYSKLDSSHSYFVVISHPPNWLCLKHISGLDCGNWGLSRPNSHVITTGTVFQSPPKMHIILPSWFKHVFPLVTPCRPGIQFNGCIHTDLLPVMRGRGRQWCKKQEPSPHFNEDLEFLQVRVGGATDACQLTKSKATGSALVWRQLLLLSLEHSP